MKRRRFLVTAIASGTTLCGCLRSPVTTPAETPRPTVTSSLVVSEGDNPHDIKVGNWLDRDVTLTIVVDRESKRLYQNRHTVAAQTERAVAGITEPALPEDSRRITATATGPNESASVDVTVTECLGDILFSYRSGDGLQATYAIC